jgi:hypothetical protein
LTIPKKWYSRNAATINFTEDSRLIGADVSTAGEGAAMLGGIASVIGEVAGMFVRHVSLALEQSMQVEPSDVEAFPEQAELDLLRTSRTNLESILIDPEMPDETDDRTSSLLKRLDFVNARIAELTAALLRWNAAGTTVIESFRCILDVAELPSERDLAQNSPLSMPVCSVIDRLGIMATIDRHDAEPATAAQTGLEQNVVYRLPRRDQIALWHFGENDGAESIASPSPSDPGTDSDQTDAATTPAASAIEESNNEIAELFDPAVSPTLPEAVLVSRTDVTIVDAACTLQSIPIGKQGPFGAKHAKLGFSEGGALVSLGTDRTSAFADAMTAVAGMGKNISDGVGTVAAVSKSFGELNPDPAEAELADLKRKADTMKYQAEISKYVNHPGV